MPEGASKCEAAAWNEWTFVLFAMYLAATPSPPTWRLVKARAIESYISLLKGYFSFSYGFDILDKAPWLRRLLQEMKLQDPLGLSRRTWRGCKGATPRAEEVEEAPAGTVFDASGGE